MFRHLLQRILAEPGTRDLDLDDPRTTDARREIVRRKSFLVRVYREWYQAVANELPTADGPTLEIGSGAGFLADVIPRLITSDLLPLRHVHVALDAQDLSFRDSSLRAIILINALHHLPDVRRFLEEAARCVQPHGRLIMIEPWVSRWSRIIYGRLHHEPFHPEAGAWTFPSTGPLSGANAALPWIITVRDRVEFERVLPQWNIESIKPMMPIKYLLSGGVSLRSLMPGWTYDWWTRVESLLERRMRDWAMFALIVMRRT